MNYIIIGGLIAFVLLLLITLLVKQSDKEIPVHEIKGIHLMDITSNKFGEGPHVRPTTLPPGVYTIHEYNQLLGRQR